MIKKAVPIVVAFLAVATAIGFVASGPLSTSSGDDAAPGSAAAPAPASERGSPEGGGDGVVADVETATGGFAADGSAVAELPGLPELGQAVVKTAEISVEVRRDTFAERFDQASLVASRYGGYVESSSVAGARASSGTLVIRVPSETFDQAMSDLRALGTVTGESVTGQVVTERFVDLEARLRTWQAQETVLLQLMAEANTVDTTLRIQRELQDVQFRIEQIRGELRVLEDRTQLASIHLSMVEVGAPIAIERGPDTRPSLAEAWEKAVDGFLGVAYATVVGLGYLVPITALGLLAWLGYRRIARRTRSEAPPATA